MPPTFARRDMVLEIGRMNQQVVIEASPEPEDPDTYGDPGDIWSVVYGDVWAEVEPLSGHRLIAAQQITAEATYAVRIWWRPGVQESMRVNWNGKLLNIEFANNPDNRQIALELLCSEWRKQ